MWGVFPPAASSQTKNTQKFLSIKMEDSQETYLVWIRCLAPTLLIRQLHFFFSLDQSLVSFKLHILLFVRICWFLILSFSFAVLNTEGVIQEFSPADFLSFRCFK